MDSVDFNEYQNFTRETAVYPEQDALTYLTLGLVSEAGEVAGKVKKALRGDYSIGSIEDALVGEIGDCMWYLARLADEIGIDLESVAIANRNKLSRRMDNGSIRGDGDER